MTKTRLWRPSGGRCPPTLTTGALLASNNPCLQFEVQLLHLAFLSWLAGLSAPSQLVDVLEGTQAHEVVMEARQVQLSTFAEASGQAVLKLQAQSADM